MLAPSKLFHATTPGVAYCRLMLVACCLLVAGRPASGQTDELSYAWKPGQEYVYHVAIDVTPSNGPKVSEQGTVRFSVEKVPARHGDSQPRRGQGTGFVVHPNGYILTCEHVTHGAGKIEVTLGEKEHQKTYLATLVAEDRVHDVALLHIDATGLPAVPLADSEKLDLGEEVLAIGYPLSDVLGSSIKITRGILSGLHVDIDSKKNLLQVDAGINHGNSGGPLLNDRGQVIGVVAMVINPDVGNNVGFAQPINEGRKLLTANSVIFETGGTSEPLAIPKLTQRVVPSVAYIVVTAKPKGGDSWWKLNYRVELGSKTHTGYTIVDAAGQVHDEGGGDLTIGVMGSIGFEPLATSGEQRWQAEQLLNFVRKTVETNPGGGGQQRPGPAAPGYGQQRRPRNQQRGQPPQVNTTVTNIPAAELSSYQVVDASAGIVTIKKSALIGSIPPGQLAGRGDGLIAFDTQAGAIRSARFSARLATSPTESTAFSLVYQRLEGSGLASLPAPPAPAPGGKVQDPPSFVPSPPDDRPKLARAPIPSATACLQAEKLLDDLYEKELAGLDSSAKRVVLATTMLRQAGGQRPGSADHYVLLEKARDLATAGGDVKLAWALIELITSHYQADALKLRAGALGVLAESVASGSEARQLVPLATALFDQAIAADRFDAARQLGRAAHAAAKRADDKSLIAETAERGKNFKSLQKSYDDFKKALATLKDDPKNAAAASVAGKYYCLVKDDWKAGLPLLAQCDDAAIAKLATVETAGPKDGQAMFELAEGWDDLAEKEQGIGKVRVQVHARAWYQKALPSLDGLARAKAEKFLASTPASVTPMIVFSSAPADPKRLLARIGKAIQDGKQKSTKEVGNTSGKPQFSIVPAQGGLLIGFDVNVDGPRIAGLRPIFLTAQGETNGRWCGSGKTGSARVAAKPGFAVGALKVKAGQGISGLSLHFMEIGSDGLNPANAYDSDWFGQASSSPVAMSGEGLPVIGIQGHSTSSEISSLGLVLAQKK